MEKPKFKEGDSVVALGDAYTIIDKVEWSEEYGFYIYWYTDDNGDSWYENSDAIEPCDISEISSITRKYELTASEIIDKYSEYLESTTKELLTGYMERIFKDKKNKKRI